MEVDGASDVNLPPRDLASELGETRPWFAFGLEFETGVGLRLGVRSDFLPVVAVGIGRQSGLSLWYLRENKNKHNEFKIHADRVEFQENFATHKVAFCENFKKKEFRSTGFNLHKIVTGNQVNI